MKDAIFKAIQANPTLVSDPKNAEFFQAEDPSALIQTDSSFLNRISPELANPIKQAFAESAVTVFFTASFVVLAAFALTWFIKELALRTKSGVQEKAEQAASSMH